MALVVAMAMTLAMAGVAFGAGHGTITINNAVEGHTYTAYPIFKGDTFDGKLSNIVWGDGITEEGKAALYTKYGLSGEDRTAAKVAEKIVESTHAGASTPGDSKAIEFADTIDTKVATGQTGTLSATTYTISDLDDGYYMIVDTWTGNSTAVSGEDYTLSRYMVQLVGTATVNNKADKPTVDKKIVEGNATTDKNTANIGDTVSYKVTSAVPEYAGYKEYYMDFKDTLSKGLTFVATPDNTDIHKGVTVTVGGTQLATSMYTVTVGDYDEATGTAITVHLLDLVSRSSSYTVGAPIVITYSATVNDNAVIGNDGNPNTMKLEYSNKPDNSGDGKPDEGDDGVKGETPNSVTKTFVTEIELDKVIKDTETALAGAVFKVKGTQINKVLITGQHFVQNSAANPAYYALTDGTYTTKAPTDATKSQYVDGTGATKFEKQTYVETSVQETADVDFQVISGVDGKIKVTGLKEGTYTFTEIQAPDGYNLLEKPIVVVVTSNIATITNPDDFKWTVGTTSDTTVVQAPVAVETAEQGGQQVDTENAANGIFKFKVENAQGTELPSTGGMGTTLLYAVGAVLVVGAGVALVARRRVASER